MTGGGAKSIRLAVDIGGTFTDIQVLDSRLGETWSFKTPTTPDDPSIGFMTGIRGAAERYGFGLDDVGLIMHGTTIATNAVLEDKLPPAALVTTRNFEDILEIGRHVRHQIYTLIAEKRRLLIPRRHRHGVDERVSAAGVVERPLDEDDARRVIDRLVEDGVEAVAVCLLNAYANPTHERRLKALIEAALPDATVSASIDTSPEIREFERTSTTVLNAMLMPVLARYLGRMAERMKELDFAARLYLVQSNGGVTTPAQAADQPVRLVLSGPAGGATAATRLARTLESPNLVAVDMGGTSLDVSVVVDGRSTIIPEGEIDGLPIRVPMIEIKTIGAGGGSIAVIDPGGRLRVGPDSAGAVPGPACYGAGGTAPTVTDANVTLARIDADYFLDGAMTLDAAAARRAVESAVADPLGMTPEVAAEGILAVANANMAGLIKLSLFEKGLDPRDFALASFGGACGLHACALAAELGIERVIFPRDPGTLSAYGILFSDIAHDVARSRLLPAIPDSLPGFREITETLRAEGEALLERDAIPAADRAYRFSADMRYRGQAFELSVPAADGPIDEAWLADLVAGFHASHQRHFAYAEPDSPIEIVTLRIAAIGHLEKPGLVSIEAEDRRDAKSHRRVWLDGGWQETAIHDRGGLSASVPMTGPVIVEEPYTTILIPAGWTVRPVASGDLVAERSAARQSSEAA